MSQYKTLQFVSKDLKTNEEYMKYEVGATISFDVDFRNLVILKRDVQLYYVNGLVDDITIVQILRNLVETNDNESEEDEIYDVIKNRIVNQQVEEVNKIDEVTDQLLSGLIAIFVNGERNAFIVDVRHYPGRQPEEPDTERVIRGSRDGFTENVVENTALTRRRVKAKRLRNEIMTVVKRYKTDISVTYINTIVDEGTLKL